MNKREELIKDFLTRCGFLVIRNNNAGSYVPEANKGRNDYDVITPNTTLYIEVKNEEEYKYIMNNYDFLKDMKNRVPKSRERLQRQVCFIEKLKSYGKHAFFCKDVQHLKKYLRELGIDYDENTYIPEPQPKATRYIGFKPIVHKRHKKRAIKLAVAKQGDWNGY